MELEQITQQEKIQRKNQNNGYKTGYQRFIRKWGECYKKFWDLPDEDNPIYDTYFENRGGRE